MALAVQVLLAINRPDQAEKQLKVCVCVMVLYCVCMSGAITMLLCCAVIAVHV